MNVWEEVVTEVKNRMPPFNDYLISHFRQDKLNHLEVAMDQRMKMVLGDQLDGVEYMGYHILSPKEAADYHLNQIRKDPIDINDTRYKLVRFDFRVKSDVGYKEESMFYKVPYLYEEHYTVTGTHYYPMFNIVDKSITRKRLGNKMEKTFNILEISTSIYLLVFRFSMKDDFVIKSVCGKERIVRILKLKAHNNLNTREKKPPALVYCFIRYGVKATLKIFGFTPDDIFLSVEPHEDPDFESYFVPNLGYVVVRQSFMDNVYRQRVVGTLLYIFKDFPLSNPDPATNLDIILNRKSEYFLYYIGNYIHNDHEKKIQKLNQVGKHLKTCERFIKDQEREILSYENIHVQDFFQLIIVIFNNIDRLLLHYDQRDIFEKRIDILQQYLFTFMMTLNRRVFMHDDLDNDPTPSDLDKLFRKRDRRLYNDKMLLWIIGNLKNMFTSINETSNDNWLLTVGAKKFRSSNMKNADKGKRKDESGAVDPKVLAHPSQLIVESILNLPSSNPCIGGTINIMFQGLKEDGTLIKPLNEDYDMIFEK